MLIKVKLFKCLFFLLPTEAYSILLLCLNNIKVQSAASQTILWGGSGPRFEPGIQ